MDMFLWCVFIHPFLSMDDVRRVFEDEEQTDNITNCENTSILSRTIE